MVCVTLGENLEAKRKDRYWFAFSDRVSIQSNPTFMDQASTIEASVPVWMSLNRYKAYKNWVSYLCMSKLRCFQASKNSSMYALLSISIGIHRIQPPEVLKWNEIIPLHCIALHSAPLVAEWNIYPVHSMSFIMKSLNGEILHSAMRGAEFSTSSGWIYMDAGTPRSTTVELFLALFLAWKWQANFCAFCFYLKTFKLGSGNPQVLFWKRTPLTLRSNPLRLIAPSKNSLQIQGEEFSK